MLGKEVKHGITTANGARWLIEKLLNANEKIFFKGERDITSKVDVWMCLFLISKMEQGSRNSRSATRKEFRRKQD